jgi:hypothetical protein
MGVLHWGDDDMHYSDGSHRWIAPENVDQSLWEAGLRAHVAQHLDTMGGPVRHDELRARWSRRARSRWVRATGGARVPRRILRLVPGEAGWVKPVGGNGSATSGGGHGQPPAA